MDTESSIDRNRNSRLVKCLYGPETIDLGIIPEIVGARVFESAIDMGL